MPYREAWLELWSAIWQIDWNAFGGFLLILLAALALADWIFGEQE